MGTTLSVSSPNNSQHLICGAVDTNLNRSNVNYRYILRLGIREEQDARYVP